MEIILILLNIIIIFVIIGGGVYFKSYLSSKANALATREEFQEVSKQLVINTKATEEVKHNLQRKHSAKSKATDLIIERMAQIETGLVYWNIMIYFRLDELEPHEAIENLGKRDSRRIARDIVELNKIVSQYSIYLSSILVESIQEWSTEVYGHLWRIETVYDTSLNYHKGKEVSNRDRMAWLSSLFEEEIYPENHKIIEQKLSINKELVKELSL